LWAERLRIGLAPGRVELVRLGPLGLGRSRAPLGVDCAAVPGQPPWAGALAALDAALPGAARAGDNAAVVLSNHFVRYLVIGWQAEIGSAHELEDLARLRFEATFGDAARDWTVRCSPSGWGQASIACAVDRALITGLQECLQRHGLRLASLQPLLMAAYNDVQRQLPPSAALTVVEPGRLCLALRRDGDWTEVSSRRAGADAALAVEQELATLSPNEAPEQLDVLLVGAGTHWAGDGERRARLLGASAPGGCSLALCGAA
jgi:hypothetical protein